MSHFTVLVVGNMTRDLITETVERMLAPYQQNNMGDCPPEFLAFNDCEDDLRAQFAALSNDDLVKYENFEKYARLYHGHDGPDEKTGRYGYWENPNAKWDWYQIGGRWSNRLLTKHGKRCDYCLFRDLDIEGMRADTREQIIPIVDKLEAVLKDGGWTMAEIPLWREMRDTAFADKSDAEKRKLVEGVREAYHGHPLVKAVERDPRTTKLFQGYAYDLDEFKGSREEAIERYVKAHGFNTHAFLRAGQWSEHGRMGWFATVINENADWPDQYAKLLETVKPTETVVLVDCHI